MTTKSYPYDVPGIYTFDSNKIDVSGGLVTLKEDLTNVYGRWHMNEATGATVLDTSGNVRNGTPFNNPPSVAGLISVGTALSFNRINQYIDLGAIASFENNVLFSIEAWINSSSVVSGNHIVVSKLSSSLPAPGWLFNINRGAGGLLEFYMINDLASSLVYVQGTTPLFDGVDHHVVATYAGTSLASGVVLYVDDAVESVTVVSDNLVGSSLNAINTQISGRNGVNDLFDGVIDEVLIHTEVLSASDVTFRYNSGSGREDVQLYNDNPTIEPTALFNPPIVLSWDAFSEALGGGNQGAIGYNLYKVDKVNKYYWDGFNWVTGGGPSNVNTAAVINANISTFDATPDEIGFLAYLIGDGTQQVELDENIITFTSNQNPLVNAGTDKEVFDNLFLAPFSDATFSDPDGTVDVAEYQVVGEVDIWTDIPQGIFATLLEAVQAFTYQFTNTGVLTVKLRVTDNQAAMSEDFLLVTVKKYTVTFSVKEVQGNHLAGFRFNAGDGSGWSDQDSPFTYDYDFNVVDPVANIDHHSYVLAAITVPTTVHTENITLEFTNAVEIQRILGMMKENHRYFNVVFTAGNLTAATIKIYPTAADTLADTNAFAEYAITAAYNIDDELVDYASVKV